MFYSNTKCCLGLGGSWWDNFSNQNFTRNRIFTQMIFSDTSVSTGITQSCTTDFQLDNTLKMCVSICIPSYITLSQGLRCGNLTLTPGDFVFWVINNFHLISEPSELWSWGTLQGTSNDTSVTNHDLSVVESSSEFWFQIEVHLWVDWFDISGGFLWNISEFLGGGTFGKTDFVDGLDSKTNCYYCPFGSWGDAY